MNPPVLYVDDDQSNLIIFESALEGIIPVLTAGSGPAALELMRKHEVAVLLTDQRMPGMSGVDLAEAVKNEFPHTVRMLITAYSDLNAAIEAINRGQIHLYLRKPWDARELRLSLEMARERYLVGNRVREMELRLASSERVYALGVIAAGITHEIRNPLGALQGNLEVAQGMLGELRSLLAQGGDIPAAEASRTLSGLDEVLADCRTASTNILEITRSMELTTRSTEAGSVDLGEVISLAERSLRAHVLKVANLDLELLPTCRVRGSRTRFGQVLMNLVLNAIEAMDPSRRLENRVVIRQFQSGDRIELEVRDNGPGIPADMLEKIFHPFFTSKPDGGTGLGLAISRQIVEELGGSLEVTSEVGKGSCFRISLPKLDAA